MVGDRLTVHLVRTIAHYAPVRRLSVALTTLPFLIAACAQVPESPESLYFERLIRIAPAGDYSDYELLEPRSSVDEEHVVADLMADGFVPQGNDSSAEMFGYITCEDLVFARTDVQASAAKYSRSFIWGSPFITGFKIQIYRNSDCSLVSVSGLRVRQEM